MLIEDGRAIIEVTDGIYTARTSSGEVISLSTDLDEVVRRINFAEKGVEIVVKLNGREMSVEEYIETLKPVIYRFTFGDSNRTGFIGVLDYKKNGRYSGIKLFDSIEEIEQYIKDRQKADEFYYVHARRRNLSRINAGGLESFELSESEQDLSRLSEALEEERARRNRRISDGK